MHKLTDALSWLFSQGQGGKDAPLPWFGALPQYALKPFKGENISEEDEQYARVLSAGYKEVGKRENVALGWRRVPKWDSQYVSVWDNPDGHRYIAVRGTHPTDTGTSGTTPASRGSGPPSTRWVGTCRASWTTPTPAASWTSGRTAWAPCSSPRRTRIGRICKIEFI